MGLQGLGLELAQHRVEVFLYDLSHPIIIHPSHPVLTPKSTPTPVSIHRIPVVIPSTLRSPTVTKGVVGVQWTLQIVANWLK